MNKVFGVGINDLGLGPKDKVYTKWCDMLKRCYSDKYPTYALTVVCGAWLYLSNFSRWLQTQAHWNILELDKDILGNGLDYSPDSCALVPHYINSLLVTRTNARGEYPLGVSLKPPHPKMVNGHKNKYRTRMKKFDRNVSLGHYACIKQAHKAWQIGKAGYILEVIEKYKLDSFYNEAVAAGLSKIANKLLLDASNNTETFELRGI